MILRKFNNIYPRTFWIAIIEKEEDVYTILKKFTIYNLLPGFDKIRKEAEEEMLKAYDGDVIAECRPVMLNSSSEMGIICIIYRPDEIDGTHIAHESVHITDYYFEVTGMNGEEFSGGGNEGYAYLVGWAAGCFIKVIKEYGKTE